ncbi:mRNA interferase HigB [Chitinophaga terrae (ex Kim and Jung 2007)]|uniref:type II toxin-antitoxin system HigB family toxin n=1 Tax=Chitinophaga terrae (ex Kim and Jung 2007) TaxID=408074 RepID=UPI002785C5E5|nr:type II toxin-antitoxin system HigB family toxin [Chitinophaga terrae (ex Kim and Jung 2007)]MDQ0107521.1 mRNA interferase HigB [Chitinophaga terrae (ex Kim and Jung 2007)]
MRIIARPILREFGSKHSTSIIPLTEWWTKLTKVSCNNFSELKELFGSVDYIGNDRYVFNIGGNNFRLVAIIRFKRQMVYIRRVLTHAEYDAHNRNGTLVTL